MAASSALSSLTSRSPSPPISRYQTAEEGTSSRGEDVTDISSPGDVVDDEDSVKTPYRDALDLPTELKGRCKIHLEEQYYIAALNLLSSTLFEGTCKPTDPALIPPPAHLAVLATLAILPKHTSRLLDYDVHDTAALSLSYLRSVLATVGPVNARLRDAFIYPNLIRSGRHTRARNNGNSDSSPSSDPESDGETITEWAANEGSIWTRGQDFWNVLGWALNCSAIHPHRWRWWKPWLEFMLDVLEADYEERMRLDLMRERRGIDSSMWRESLLLSYIEPKNSRSKPLPRIMNALFADGNSSSVSLFKEVFSREPKIRSETSKKRKRGSVNPEHGNFADYDDQSSTGGSEPPTPEHQRMTGKDKYLLSWPNTALAETVHLRLRVFALLSRACVDAPDQCNFTLPDLFMSFVKKLKALPLPAFSRFIASHDSPLDTDCLKAILRILLPSLLSSNRPSTKHIDPDADARGDISPIMLEKCYLPFSYGSAENNAKISIAVETLLRIMWTTKNIKWTPAFHQAVVKGIEARQAKSEQKQPKAYGENKDRKDIAQKKVRKVDNEQPFREVLHASASRLLALSQILQVQGEGDT